MLTLFLAYTLPRCKFTLHSPRQVHFGGFENFHNENIASRLGGSPSIHIIKRPVAYRYTFKAYQGASMFHCNSHLRNHNCIIVLGFNTIQSNMESSLMTASFNQSAPWQGVARARTIRPWNRPAYFPSTQNIQPSRLSLPSPSKVNYWHRATLASRRPVASCAVTSLIVSVTRLDIECYLVREREISKRRRKSHTSTENVYICRDALFSISQTCSL